MCELTTLEMQELEGGSILTGLIYVAIGAGIYKILTTTRGKITITKLITLEWRN